MMGSAALLCVASLLEAAAGSYVMTDSTIRTAVAEYCLQRIDARSWRRAASCCSAAFGAALSAAMDLVVGAARRRDGRRRAVCQRASSSAWSGEGSPAEGSRAECCFGLAYL